MALVDDLEDPSSAQDAARRRFRAAIGGSALSVGAIGTTVTTLRFIEPTVIYQEDKRIAVGPPEEFPVGAVAVLSNGRVFLLRTERGFIALSAVCTHLGCVVRADPDTRGFACPCHGSRYHGDGTVRQGPAVQALRRLALSVERGVLVIDAARVVEPDAVFTVRALAWPKPSRTTACGSPSSDTGIPTPTRTARCWCSRTSFCTFIR